MARGGSESPHRRRAGATRARSAHDPGAHPLSRPPAAPLPRARRQRHGIVTERDFIMKLGQGDEKRSVRDFMTPDPEVLSPDDPIVYALNKMSVGGFRHVPLVTEAGQPVGVVSAKDIIDYIADFFPNEVLTVPPDPARGERWRGRDGG
ncbi:MAG: CBS domain-containing protein [Deltaproteobacteria bacterium]|nr:MAG: CBS domain-containing protein [Deltaproteobacteria bacterium]